MAVTRTLTTMSPDAGPGADLRHMLQAVVSKECNDEKVEMNVGWLCAGVYFVKVNGIYAGKFMKE